MPENSAPPQVRIGTAKIHAVNVVVREDVVLDEVDLEGSEVVIEPPASERPAAFHAGETRFRAVVSEPNLNRFLAANPLQDAPVRHLNIALMTGKARITGQVVKVFAMPFTVEGVPKVENGIRVYLDCRSAKLSFADLPGSVVDLIEQSINKHIPLLSGLSIPVYVDDIRCEPGRLIVTGKVRIAFPPAAQAAPILPFSAREMPAVSRDAEIRPLPAAEPAPALSAGDESPTVAEEITK